MNEMTSVHCHSGLSLAAPPSQISPPPRVCSPPDPGPSHYDDTKSSGLSSDYHCCSSPSSSSLSSSPSLYATFKIFQLVNSFCRRVKTRVSVQNRRCPTKKEGASLLQDHFCQEFERRAFEEIDKYLGRKPYRPHLKVLRPDDGTHAAECVVDGSTVNEKVQRLLDLVNQAFSPDQPGLTSIAKSNQSFLLRAPNFRLKRLSLKHLQRLLLTIFDLLTSLRHASQINELPIGKEVGEAAIDETYIANLEHLLLCLQDQLLRLLVAKLVQIIEKHVSECQRDQGKREENWFFEFPDARHPLSTTWPWSIRPSLAVLWGVCWMFYDSTIEFDQSGLIEFQGQFYCFDREGNMVDMEGGIVVPARDVRRYRQGMQQMLQQQQQQQGVILRSPGHNMSRYPSAQQQQQQQQQHHVPTGMVQGRSAMPSSGGPSARALAAPQITVVTSEEFGGVVGVAASPSSGRGGAQENQVASTRPGNNNSNTTAYSAAGASASAAPSQAAYTSGSIGSATRPHPHVSPRDWVPQVPQDYTSGFDHTANPPWSVAESAPFANYNTALPHQDTYNHFTAGLPPRTSHLTPTSATLRVPPHLGGLNTTLDASQPQDSISPLPASSSPYTPHQQHHSYWPSQQHHDSLSPIYRRSVNMPGAISDEPQLGPANHAPPSPQSHGHSPQFDMAPPGPPVPDMNRKRSFDDFTEGQGDIQTRSRANSHTSGNNSATSPAQDEFGQRQVPRTIKRGDPPVNHDNKYVCDFAEECRGITFDRKCEWSKHMDKHDRPYRCPHPQCAKLQGFTYSGGLLRHEREVHDKHGGPKAKLMCPHADCKRHSGKGFTRKENLNEHIRRVHSGKELVPGDSMDIPPKADTNEHPFGTTEDFESSIAPELQDFDPTMNDNKRRRLNSITDGEQQIHLPESEEDLKAQVYRLREDNMQKDAEIRRLQEIEAVQADRLKNMEEALRRMHQAQQAQNGLSQLPDQQLQMQDDLSQHQQHHLPQV